MFMMLEADDSFSFEKKLRLTGRIRTFRSGKS
jgi:hypothetical protein